MSRVLVDTSVWVAHFRQRSDPLVQLLVSDRVLMHPLVLGEIACGTPPRRAHTLADLASLQPAPQQATLEETMLFIEREQLHGAGCGIVDVLLLATARLSGAQLWTLDQRLNRLALRFGMAYAAGLRPR